MELPDRYSDERLIRACQSGDLSARDELVDRFLPDIHRLCRFLLREPSIVDDAVQESFLRIFRYLHRWDGRPPKPWMLAIAYNRCVTFRQNQGKHREQTIQDEPVQADSQHELLMEAELSCAVNGALGMLRPQFRDVLVLHHVAGLPVEDIARQLKIPAGTVKTWLSRGRQALWDQLKTTGHVEGEMPRRPREDR